MRRIIRSTALVRRLDVLTVMHHRHPAVREVAKTSADKIEYKSSNKFKGHWENFASEYFKSETKVDF
ncbi:MAG: hypothetical protein D3910_10155 [Candidatus Electrothrix sp. ATG2]|nr:hypothetical protein [Candidatus Electrothrix sp. ATG2]